MQIGLLRGGRLLAEESPEKLLQLFNTDSLEKVFLNLSKQQEEGRLAEVEELPVEDQNNSIIMGSINSIASNAITTDGSREVI